MIDSKIGKCVVRAATPDHADEAAALIYETDQHVFGYWLKGGRNTVLRYFAEQWKLSKGLFSHALCIGVYDEDALIGIELGYDRKTKRQEGRAFFENAQQYLTGEQFNHFLKAMGYMPFLNPPVPRDAYYIQNLAVQRGIRKQGIGAKLIQDAFDRAVRRGYRSCHLDVSGDNPAFHFYQRMGMDVLNEMRVPYLDERYNIPVHYRMVKML